MTRRDVFTIAGGLAARVFTVGDGIGRRTRGNLIVVEIQPRRSVMTVYKDGAVVATEEIVIAGRHFVNDLAYHMQWKGVPPQWGPELIETVGILPPGARYSSVSSARGQFEQVFSIRRCDVAEVLEARAVEFAEFVRDVLTGAQVGQEFGAPVLLAGACARMPGLAETVGQVLNRPVQFIRSAMRL